MKDRIFGLFAALSILVLFSPLLPLLMEYLTRYSPEQARRHEVKPGITGWDQINGRNAITREDGWHLWHLK